MSLRLFHLCFIALSIALALFLAAWAGGQYRATHEWVYAFTSGGVLVIGTMLAVYGAAFQRKTRHL